MRVASARPWIEPNPSATASSSRALRGDLLGAVTPVEGELGQAQMGVEDDPGELGSLTGRLQKLLTEKVPPCSTSVAHHPQQTAGLAQLPAELCLDGEVAGQPGGSLGLLE